MQQQQVFAVLVYSCLLCLWYLAEAFLCRLTKACTADDYLPALLLLPVGALLEAQVLWRAS